MTLVVDNQRGAAPSTHALVIGVGGYPHLDGGNPQNDPNIKTAAETFGLGQLTSPVTSARAFADWLFVEPPAQGGFANPAAPLGTVEMLLTPGAKQPSPQMYNGKSVDPATFDGVKAAFNEWFQRCDANRDNLAIFYFCGHGLQLDVTVLLPSDCGQDDSALLSPSIDFTTSELSMSECKAKAQCFFLDACRETSNEERVHGGVGHEPLRKKKRAGFPYTRSAPRLLAARAGQKAYGEDLKVSFFTTELLKCLRGQGATPAGGGMRWRVTTDSIRPAIKQLMLRQTYEGKPLGCATDGQAEDVETICELAGPPPVPAKVALAPDPAHVAAELSAKRAGFPPRQRAAAGGGPPWELVLEGGSWDLEARFPPGNGWQTLSHPGLIVLPPFFEPDPFPVTKT